MKTKIEKIKIIVLFFIVISTITLNANSNRERYSYLKKVKRPNQENVVSKQTPVTKKAFYNNNQALDLPKSSLENTTAKNNYELASLQLYGAISSEGMMKKEPFNENSDRFRLDTIEPPKTKNEDQEGNTSLTDVYKKNDTQNARMANDTNVKANITNNTTSEKIADKESELSGMALTGFICGVCGFILVITAGWPFFLGALGTIFSSIGLKQTLRGRKGKGFAIAGLALSILTIIFFWIGIIAFVSLLNILFL